MTQNQINNKFKAFKIEEHNYPIYKDPVTFANGIKKCSLLNSAPSIKTNKTWSADKKDDKNA